MTTAILKNWKICLLSNCAPPPIPYPPPPKKRSRKQELDKKKNWGVYSHRTKCKHSRSPVPRSEQGNLQYSRFLMCKTPADGWWFPSSCLLHWEAPCIASEDVFRLFPLQYLFQTASVHDFLKGILMVYCRNIEVKKRKCWLHHPEHSPDGAGFCSYL